MGNDSITNKLNTAFFGDTNTSPKQITMEDIARCRGSSQSIGAMALNQLKTFWNKGEFVTDATVKRILIQNGINNADGISHVFTESTRIGDDIVGKEKHEIKQIRRDQKMAADLAKIIGKAAGKLGYDQIQASASEAHLILTARRQLEKYEPLELLRAVAFEASQGVQEEGAKEAFIEYLQEKGKLPKDEQELRTVYSAFIKETVSIVPGNPDVREKFQKFGKENTVASYLTHRSLEHSGLLKQNVTEKFENMSYLDLVSSMRDTLMPNLSELERKMDSTREGTKEQRLANIKELFNDKFAEPVLGRAAERSQNEDMHTFIKQVLDMRSSPIEQQGAKMQQIRKDFFDEGAKYQLNITTKEGNDFDKIFEHVVDTYINNMFSAEMRGIIKEEGYAEYGIKLKRESVAVEGTTSSEVNSNQLKGLFDDLEGSEVNVAMKSKPVTSESSNTEPLVAFKSSSNPNPKPVTSEEFGLF